MPRPLTAVQVVVPAHDEEQLVRACLVSVLVAVEALGRARPDLVTGVTLVLDRCTDATAAVTADLPVDQVHLDAGRVGAARRAGVAHARTRVAGHDPQRVLVVGTDADCTVAPDWLCEHVRLLGDHDLVQGWVDPDPGDLHGGARDAWLAAHPPGRGSLHGANLSVRLDAYDRAGGFPAVAAQEDLLLVRELKRLGSTAVHGTHVTTSGRRTGRAPGGFAGFLRDLDAGLATTRPDDAAAGGAT